MSSELGAGAPPIQTASVESAPMLDVWFASDERHRHRMQPLLEWPRTQTSFVGRVEFQPDDLEMPHSHSAEEIVYVLEGTLEMTVGADAVTVQEGGVVAVPAGVLHSPKNVGDGPLRALVFLSGAVVAHAWEDRVMPLGQATFVTPLG